MKKHLLIGFLLLMVCLSIVAVRKFKNRNQVPYTIYGCDPADPVHGLDCISLRYSTDN